MRRNEVHCIDYLDGFANLEPDSIDMIMTSPPYWQARSYGMEATIGFEDSPRGYVENLRPFLRESLRVLKPTGGLWLNVGDSRSQGNRRQRGRRDTTPDRKSENFAGWADWDGDLEYIKVDHGVPPKSFIGIPEMVMFAAMEEGFIVRNKIVWAKGIMKYDGDTYGGTTPAPFKDNFALCWEPVYYLTKTKFNYFNMDKAQVPAKKGGMKAPLNVWAIPPSAGREKFSYKDQKNFATYPPALTDITVGAGCPPWVCASCLKPVPMLPAYKLFKHCDWCEDSGMYSKNGMFKGVVLDPFAGSGTTALSAIKHNVDYILFDISKEQVDYAKARIENYVQNQ